MNPAASHEDTRLGIPADFHERRTAPGWFTTATSFPSEWHGPTWDPALAIGPITGLELARSVTPTSMAPPLDVSRDQRGDE